MPRWPDWRPGTGRLPLPPALKQALRRQLVEEFHKYYYVAGPWKQSTWLGVPVLQYPGDLVVLQEIVWETRPELVVETGTLHGGTARFFASLFDLIGEGEVISIDIDHSRVRTEVREHQRVTLITGDSTAAETTRRVLELARGRRAMVYLDADHRREAVRAELAAYAGLVAPGCYAVVADSNLNGHPVPWLDRRRRDGPYEAVAEFLAERHDFVVDPDREYQLVTFNPHGFLRRTRTTTDLTGAVPAAE
jgi:cephalosporin hydroxylase